MIRTIINYLVLSTAWCMVGWRGGLRFAAGCPCMRMCGVRGSVQLHEGAGGARQLQARPV